MLGELNVSQMQACLDVTQSNVSQHLAILKAKGIIEGKRNGNKTVYSLIDNDVKNIVEVFLTGKKYLKTKDFLCVKYANVLIF